MNLNIFDESGTCIKTFYDLNPDFCSNLIGGDYIIVNNEEYRISKIVYDFDCLLLKIHVFKPDLL